MSEAVKLELTQFLIKSIWGGLPQDRFYVLAPTRISITRGAYRELNYFNRVIPLPDQVNKWHVYSVGAVYTDTFNIPASDLPVPFSSWGVFTDTINNNNVILDLYNGTGVQFPKNDCYHLYTNHGVLLIAVRDNDRIPVDYTDERVYLRHYKSSYVESMGDHLSGSHHSVVVSNNTDVTTFQDRCNLLNGNTPYRCYHNGLLVDKFYIDDIVIGDTIEYKVEPNIRERYHFNIDQLPTFISEKDSQHKYLLTFDHDDIKTTRYVDDVDVFIYYKGSNGRTKGLYYHRNRFMNLRSVTHMSYSILTQMVESYKQTLSKIMGLENILPEDLYVEISIKNSLSGVGMVNDKQRMLDLHRLSLDDRLTVMTGVDSVHPQWNVNALENSDTCEVMYDQKEELTVSDAIGILDYDAVSRVLCPSPIHLKSANGYMETMLGTLPGIKSHLYEYTNGLLINHYDNVEDRHYTSINGTDTLEVILGTGGDDSPSQLFKSDDIITFDEDYGYRIYRINNGVVSDITHTDEYNVVDNVIQIKGSDEHEYLLKQDYHHYVTEQVFPSDCFTHNIQLKETYDHYGDQVLRPLIVPYRYYDVWVNGHTLVEGLHYTVKHPFITINNKEYLNQNTTNTITIRGVGFCDRDLHHRIPKDIGFVQQGLISTNEEYNVREGRNLSIFVDSRLSDVNDVKFQEEDDPSPSPYDGRPYCIKEVYVPMTRVIGMDTIEYFNDTESRRKPVEEYLTISIDNPTVTPTPPDNPTINYSPFFATLLHKVVTGVLVIEESDLVNNQAMIDKIGIVSEWLPLDTTYQVLQDELYVKIHPHPFTEMIKVPMLTYQFLLMVNEHYFGNRIIFDNLLSVNNYD